MKFDSQICGQYLQGWLANCANNCPGVDPNSIIGGGVAAVALSGLAGQALLAPALGAGGIAVAGVGGAAAMGMLNCGGGTPCRVTSSLGWKRKFQINRPMTFSISNKKSNVRQNVVGSFLAVKILSLPEIH